VDRLRDVRERMAGSGTFRLVRDVEDPRRYTSFAPWESFEAQRSWKAFRPSVQELVTRVD
jgi:heme-degrading monooxygenase HmoA